MRYAMTLPKAALLAVSLALFANSTFAKEPPRFASDARQIRIESPQLFLLAPEAATVAAEGLPFAATLAPAAFGPVPSACERSGSALCFDSIERRLVYRPARQFMPRFDGLTAEGISLRRDSIRFRYSFR
jgi:hypothetical protein